MRTRDFPVLSDDEEPLVARLELGLGRNAARVLAYLLRRDDGLRPADRLAIRIGTGANQSAVSDALGRLEARELVRTTTLETDTGRPPTAWTARLPEAETIHHVDRTHADALLGQATTVAAELSGNEPVETTWDTTNERADTALNVGLGWFPNVLHAPLFAANAEGAFADWGLDVTIESFAGSDRALDALVAGDVDVAVAGAATIVRRRECDQSLVPLAPLYQRAMTVLYTTPEAFGGPLDGVESIRGRRVGMPLGAETGALGRLFLSQSGTLDDVDLVDLAGEERDALASGQADVVTGSVLDPRELRADGVDVDVIRVADHFPIYGPTFVTTERVLSSSPAAVAGFLAGVVAGWHHARTDPAAAIRAIEDHGNSLSEGAVTDLEYVLDTFGTSSVVNDHGWGWHDASGWQRLSTALSQVGLLSGHNG